MLQKQHRLQQPHMLQKQHRLHSKLDSMWPQEPFRIMQPSALSCLRGLERSTPPHAWRTESGERQLAMTRYSHIRMPSAADLVAHASTCDLQSCLTYEPCNYPHTPTPYRDTHLHRVHTPSVNVDTLGMPLIAHSVSRHSSCLSMTRHMSDDCTYISKAQINHYALQTSTILKSIPWIDGDKMYIVHHGPFPSIEHEICTRKL